MSEEVLGERVEKADVFMPFTPSFQESYDTQPTYRLLIDVSESSSMGYLERGYYIKINESTYFIRKKQISVFTNTQAERVLEFLRKTKSEFTVDVRHDKTNSGHQYVQLVDIDIEKGIYAVRDFSVYRSLWQVVEGELFENTYSPSMARFTDGRLVWYAKLMPEHSLTFTHVAKITLNYVGAQGHLEVFKLEKEGDFDFPYYLYREREGLQFFNHEIKTKVSVIPLGSERRIVNLSRETQITSPEHEPLLLPAGEYLLFHPRPRDAVD